ARAGFTLRRRNPGRAWWGDVRLEFRNGSAYVASLVSTAAPLYAVGVEQDDEVRLVDGQRIESTDALMSILQRHRPGDRIQLVYADRTGVPRTVTVTLGEDPHLEVAANESAGGTLPAEQRAFRDAWP